MTAQLDVFTDAATDEARRSLARRTTSDSVRGAYDVLLERFGLGGDFSANDLRGHVTISPTVLRALERYDVIEEAGREPSTDPGTRGATVKRYLLRRKDGAPREDPAAVNVRRRRYGQGWRWRAESPNASIEADSRGILDELLRLLVLRSGLPVREQLLPAPSSEPAALLDRPQLAAAVLDGLRGLNGALTVAGLRARLAGVPDDALVLIHTEGSDGDVLGIANAFDTAPDDGRHVFRVVATDDPDDLLAAAEEPSHA